MWTLCPCKYENIKSDIFIKFIKMLYTLEPYMTVISSIDIFLLFYSLHTLLNTIVSLLYRPTVRLHLTCVISGWLKSFLKSLYQNKWIDIYCKNVWISICSKKTIMSINTICWTNLLPRILNFTASTIIHPAFPSSSC